MTRLRAFLVSLLLGVALVGLACDDSAIGPATVTTDSATPEDTLAADGGVPGPVEGEQARALERNTPLEEDEVVTETIQPLTGGTITLPRAGLTVVFLPLTVDEPTEVTVRAPAGDLVGYHFEPHGLEFKLPVVVTQDLRTTLGLGLTGMSAVYFEGDLDSAVTAREVLPLTLLELVGIFEIRHFSGYIIATN